MTDRKQLKRGESQMILNEEQIEELKLAFDMFDEAGQGYLTKENLRACVDKYGVKVASKSIDEMFKEADVTGSGKIGFPEFMNMMARKMKQTDSQDEVLEAFKVFDPYGEGIINEKELTDALLNTGDKLTKEELEEMYSVCRIDGNINYKSFVAHMFASK